MPDYATPSTPVTIIGGYLGAGKTTLVNRLLRAATERITVLVNDFGSSVIDAALVEGREGDVLQLAGGCVCCQIGDDLSEALVRLAAPSARGEVDGSTDRIVIETSGVAQPAAVAATVGFTPGLSVDAVVVVADGERVESLLADRYVGDLVAAQLRQADVVVVNRSMGTDLRPYTAAPVLLDDGGLVADVVLSVPPVGRRGEAPIAGAAQRFTSVVVPAVGDVADVLAAVHAIAGLVRAKGFVHAPDGSVHLVQVAGARVSVSPWTRSPVPASGVLCIALR